MREWNLAAQAAARAEVKLVVGTSAIVHPAASLALGDGAFVVEINPEETAISSDVDATFRSRASEMLPEIERQLSGN